MSIDNDAVRRWQHRDLSRSVGRIVPADSINRLGMVEDEQPILKRSGPASLLAPGLFGPRQWSAKAAPDQPYKPIILHRASRSKSRSSASVVSV